MRCQIAARPDVADDVRTAGAVAIPEVGHVPAAFDDTGVVALAAPPVVEVGVGVLDHPRARLVLTEAGEEAEGRTAFAGTCRVGRAVALFARLIQAAVTADAGRGILEVEHVARIGGVGIVGEILVQLDLAGRRIRRGRLIRIAELQRSDVRRIGALGSDGLERLVPCLVDGLLRLRIVGAAALRSEAVELADGDALEV